LADLLAPGLWWLHGTRGSNVYLVEADDGQLALVDTVASLEEAILAMARVPATTVCSVVA